MWKRVMFSVLLLVGVGFAVADGLFGFLSDGGDVVSVPSLCGEREESLVIPEWAVLETEYRYHAEIPAGEVFAQEPAAGSLKKISDRNPCRIKLTVSMGRERVLLPDLLGENAASAAARLRNLGLTVVEQSVRGGVSGTVARTEPQASASLEIGATVTLFVYTKDAAKSISVPDLSGLTRENAILQLFLSGLRVGEIREEESPAFDGTVIRQSPTARSYVAQGTRVGIVISKQIFEE